VPHRVPAAFSLGSLSLAAAQLPAQRAGPAHAPRGGAAALRALSGGGGDSKRALCVLATGFEEMETVAPIDILRRANVEVTVAALSSDLTVKGRNGMSMVADTDLDSAMSSGDFDVVIIPGGPPAVPAVGTLKNDARVIALLQSQMTSGRLVSAICAAPSVLAHAGVLNGKKHTAHFSVAEVVPDMDKMSAVVVDENLITSQGAGTATEFALALVEKLVDKAVSCLRGPGVACSSVSRATITACPARIPPHTAALPVVPVPLTRCPSRPVYADRRRHCRVNLLAALRLNCRAQPGGCVLRSSRAWGALLRCTWREARRGARGGDAYTAYHIAIRSMSGRQRHLSRHFMLKNSTTFGDELSVALERSLP